MGPAGSRPAAGPRARFVRGREVAVIATVLAALLAAWRLFDEWRPAIGMLLGLALAGSGLLLGARVAAWAWDRLDDKGRGAALSAALAWGVVSWLDTLVASAVRGMSEGNYAVIILAPLALLLGLAVSLGGLAAAAVGGTACWRGLTGRDGSGGLRPALGALAAALNLGAIARLLAIFG